VEFGSPFVFQVEFGLPSSVKGSLSSEKGSLSSEKGSLSSESLALSPPNSDEVDRDALLLLSFSE